MTASTALVKSIHKGAALQFQALPQPQTSNIHHAAITAILLIILPFFGQSFYYMVQWPILYYISKGWPVIIVLLTLRGMLGERLPLRTLFLMLFSYTIGLTPIMAMAQFGGSLTDSMLTTVKIWPFTYYFALLALLVVLRPSINQLGQCVLALGAITFILMPLLWFSIPSGWYSTDAVNAKFLLFDVERGYRIYMPMFFGMLFFFYLVRRFTLQRETWVAIAVGLCFIILMMIYKQRVSIIAAAMVAGLVLTPSHWRRLVIATMLITCAILLTVLIIAPPYQSLFNMLGGSLSVRLMSLQSAISFIGHDPINWLLGKGTISRFSDINMAEVLGNNYFFLADIGWIGVIFEYGLLGAALILVVYIAGYRLSRQIAISQSDRSSAAFSLAISDYVLFMLIQSAVYSLVFVPGELATLLAIAVYLDRMNPVAQANSVEHDEPVPPPSVIFNPPQSVIFHAPSHSKTRF